MGGGGGGGGEDAEETIAYTMTRRVSAEAKAKERAPVKRDSGEAWWVVRWRRRRAR